MKGFQKGNKLVLRRKKNYVGKNNPMYGVDRSGEKGAFWGRKHSEETKKKIGIGNWKGDKVGYSGLHAWVRKELGKPNHCAYCQTTTAKKYEWANISHSYKRELSDWIRLCVSCHRLYDNGKIKLK